MLYFTSPVKMDGKRCEESRGHTCGQTLGVGSALTGLALTAAWRVGDTGTDCACSDFGADAMAHAAFGGLCSTQAGSHKDDTSSN